jgi:hypothetical protein
MRLYGIMQHLMIRLAHAQTAEQTDPRGIVQLQDALDAILQVAAFIDQAAQSGQVPAEPAVHAAAMLMVARDYIRPLPPGLAGDGQTDRATTDLKKLTAALRTARRETGMHG